MWNQTGDKIFEKNYENHYSILFSMINCKNSNVKSNSYLSVSY